MLTKKEIMKKFGCEAFDANEILAIQAKGLTHGLQGVTFATPDDFEDAIGLDIEHVETLMLADEGSVRAVYDAAVRAGRARRTTQKAA